MKHHLTDDGNFLFNSACKVLKFFLLSLFGFVIAYVISQVFGVDTIVQMLLSPSLWEWLGRIAVFIFCLFAVAIIYESSH
ncbi:hypothetical protein [Nostoc sp. CHAB 5715]|jgi:nucleoside recognition membrane protein YjiH|uniref:hypothetical protein n=1 Tax=Nostoc sp. CHAB 5715 TaxID=2780400 RepID=UPI001E61771E|nr:hypothetical protein [Nostoc sp. CHAB 5715]MCC5620638.1 hypothetical protein [Nostoc sp. CHAB 5715]